MIGYRCDVEGIIAQVRVQVRLKFESTTMTILVWFDDDELVIRLCNASEV